MSTRRTFSSESEAFGPIPLDEIRARARQARERARELVGRAVRVTEPLVTLSAREVKACSCGRAFTRLTWKRLPFVGMWNFDGRKMEARSCQCRSSLIVRFPLVP